MAPGKGVASASTLMLIRPLTLMVSLVLIDLLIGRPASASNVEDLILEAITKLKEDVANYHPVSDGLTHFTSNSAKLDLEILHRPRIREIPGIPKLEVMLAFHDLFQLGGGLRKAPEHEEAGFMLVTPEFIPILSLPPHSENAKGFFHEYDHFKYWLELRAELISRGESELKASKGAAELMLTPDGTVVSESRAMIIELSFMLKESKSAKPIDLGDIWDSAMYPLLEGYFRANSIAKKSPAIGIPQLVRFDDLLRQRHEWFIAKKKEADPQADSPSYESIQKEMLIFWCKGQLSKL